MAHRSDPRFVVLHTLRLKGFAEAEPVAAAVGADVQEVVGELERLAKAELVLRRDGNISGWSLTPAGRDEHARLLADDLRESEARAAVQDAYRRFLEINPDLLAACTAWQLRDVGGQQVPNDHSDPDHDRAVVGQLVAIHDRVRPVCADLRDALERFSRYGTRLRSALERVVAGEVEWFTKPVIDSYHTVWFEMHEDLLCTLGIQRGQEEL